MNVWDGKTVTVNAGARVRVWSDEDCASSMETMPTEEAWRPHQVVSAIACPTIHGGGSELTLIEVDHKGRDLGFGYRVYVHSSLVAEVRP